MAKPRKQTDPIDTGPPERQQHNKVRIERDINNRARLRVVDQLEIDRLLLENKITMDQHSAGEHLYELITFCGYFPGTKWSLDANIRGDTQGIGNRKANAMVKIGLAKVWLHAKVGEPATRLLLACLLGERKVPDRLVPIIGHGLSSYRSFEGWWYGRDTDLPIPVLLSDMPRRIQTHQPRSFHHEV